MNLISIIIPTYQHAKTLPICLDSLYAQTRKADEIIIVDDGSTDETVSVLAPYLNHVRYIFQKNQGAPAARNHGFSLSKGGYVLFCDADVRAKPDMLEKFERTLLNDPEASWVYSSFQWGWKSFHSRSFDPFFLSRQNYIHTNSLIRREHFPGFDSSLTRFQDWDVWLTMLEQGRKGTFINETLFQILPRHSRSGISQWRPSFMYHIPWKRIGCMPPSVKAYFAAKSIVLKKHSLE